MTNLLPMLRRDATGKSMRGRFVSLLVLSSDQGERQSAAQRRVIKGASHLFEPDYAVKPPPQYGGAVEWRQS